MRNAAGVHWHTYQGVLPTMPWRMISPKVGSFINCTAACSAAQMLVPSGPPPPTSFTYSCY